MTHLSLRIAPVALAALLCAPVAAVAQSTTTAPAPSASAPAAAAPSTAAPSTTAESPEARVSQRINELHAELHITQAQEPMWKKFSSVMRTNAREMDAAVEQRAENFDSMNAVQNMQSYAKLAEAHAEHMKRLVTAFDSLYKSLPATQKKLADDAFRARAAQHAAAQSAK